MTPVLVTVRNPATPGLTTVYAVAPRDVARWRQRFEPWWPTRVLAPDALPAEMLAECAATLANTAHLGYDYDALTVGTFDASGEWKVWLPDVPEPPVPGRLRALAADG